MVPGPLVVDRHPAAGALGERSGVRSVGLVQVVALGVASGVRILVGKLPQGMVVRACCHLRLGVVGAGLEVVLTLFWVWRSLSWSDRWALLDLDRGDVYLSIDSSHVT